MSEKIKVSVVIPTYNSISYLNTAVDSVLSQTFKGIEVLVVDDGSTDNTRKILFEKYGDKIRYLYKENGGVSSARNYGIKKARGKYIAFLDADDYWMPEKIEKQVGLMESNDKIGFCYVSTQRVDENLILINSIPAKEYEDYCEALLLDLNVVSGSCSSAMVRREVTLQTEGFDSQFSTYADWEYWLRLSLTTKFAPIKDELVKYRVVKGSMSSNPSVTEKDALGVLNKFFKQPNLPLKYLKIKDKVISNHFMVLSGEFLHAGRIKQSLKYMLKAISLHPQNLTRPIGLPFRYAKRLVLNQS